MKKHLLRLSVIAALAASASFAETYYANVPFNFVLKNKTLPAGAYMWDSAAVSGVMVIRSDDRKITCTMMGSSLKSENKGQEGRLVFHRYGNRYFLEQVWTRDGAGHQLPLSARERELKAQRRSPTAATVALR